MNITYTQNLIIKLCAQPRSLDYITSHLHGVDPITALKFLKELEDQEILRRQDDLWLIEANARKEIVDLLDPNPQLYLKKYMGDLDFFKKPHPLDFEWRNTKNSVNYLSELVLADSAVDDQILILGMPTLFANLCKKDILQKITIVERNKGVIETLKEMSHATCKVYEADIFKVDPTTIGSYTTVVMDPPWYEPHFFQFIWVASRCLKLGGRLIISIPPVNTRPGIAAERVKWFTFSEKQGLCLSSLFANRLEYAMPFFEWNSARITGAVVSPFWRRGDVAIFQKLENQYIDRPPYSEQENAWREIEIDGCRFRILIDESHHSETADNLDIKSLVPAQILGSVSSREPIRKEANIWTSGNRIFKTNKPRAVYSALQLFKDKIKSKTEEEREVFNWISLISGFENDEHNQYLDWFYRYLENETN